MNHGAVGWMGRIVGAAMCSAMLIPLVSCSDNEPGSPSAAPAATTTSSAGTSSTSTSSSPSSSSKTSSGNPLSNVDPCGLLSSTEATQLGLGVTGDPTTIGGDRVCRWSASGRFSALLGLNDDQGLDQLNYQGQTPTPIQVGKRKAQQARIGGDRQCGAFLGVSNSSSVAVNVTYIKADDGVKACETALNIAKIVDPKLPWFGG